MVMCSTFSPLPGSDSGSHLQFEHWTNPTSLLAPELIYLFRSAILVAQTITGSIRFHAVSFKHSSEQKTTHLVSHGTSLEM